MPIKRVPKIEAWSFSRLKDWLTCAKMAWFKHVDKSDLEPASEPMIEGSYVDHIVEAYTTQVYDKPLDKQIVHLADRFARDLKLIKKGKLPEELARFPEELAQLRAMSSSLLAQEQLSFDKDWKLLPPRAWFDNTGPTRVRVKLDVSWTAGRRCYVVDYKNGKVRQEDVEQLELYVLAKLIALPQVDDVEPALWYLKQGVILPEVPRVYGRAELPALKKKWSAKAKPMLLDETFKPNPGRHCEWCHWAKSRGGTCEAG